MQDRSQQTRSKILNTSFHLFLQNGYDTTGVAQICEEASISKGAFYHHFPSKHDVFLTILDEWIEALESRFRLIEDSELSVPQQIQQMASSLKDIFSESEKIPLFLEFWMQSMRDKSVSKRTLAPYFHFLNYFQHLIEKGVQEGSFDESTNSKETSRLLMSFAMGSILQSMLEPEKDWQMITESNLNSILSAIQRSKK